MYIILKKEKKYIYLRIYTKKRKIVTACNNFSIGSKSSESSKAGTRGPCLRIESTESLKAKARKS